MFQLESNVIHNRQIILIKNNSKSFQNWRVGDHIGRRIVGVGRNNDKSEGYKAGRH